MHRFIQQYHCRVVWNVPSRTIGSPCFTQYPIDDLDDTQKQRREHGCMDCLYPIYRVSCREKFRFLK